MRIIKSGPVCYQGEPWFAPHNDAYARPIKMDKEQLRHFVSDGTRLVTLLEVGCEVFLV